MLLVCLVHDIGGGGKAAANSSVQQAWPGLITHQLFIHAGQV